MTMTQPKITFFLQGKPLGIQRPAPPVPSTAPVIRSPNDDVRMKHRHMISPPPPDIHKRPREHTDNTSSKKKMKPAAATSSPPPTLFKSGQRVEVRSDEQGFEGAWYGAEIVGFLGYDKYLVKYRTLLTDDEERLLRDKTTSRYIRPHPPRPPERPFKSLDKVDVWFNDGWWEGEVSKRLADDDHNKYAVYFKTTNEELVFRGTELRLHLDWVNGKWVLPKPKAAKINVVGGSKIGMDRYHEANLIT